MPAAPNLPSLTLSPSLLSTLQPQTYLHHTLTHSSVRPDGRKPTQARPLTCTTSSLTHCAGSSLVRCGDTAVICGIQPEILIHSRIPDPPRPRLTEPRSKAEKEVREQDEIANLGLLVPNVELNTGCHPSFLPGEGRAPGQLQQSLAVRLLRLSLSTRLIALEDLLIRRGSGPQAAAAVSEDLGEKEQEVVGYWVLYITLMPLSLDGTTSLFHVLWTALYTALQDVKLPRAWWDADRESVICSDRVDEARRLQLRGRPVSLTFGVFVPGPHIWSAMDSGEAADEKMEDAKNEGAGVKRWILADPDAFEDGLCEEAVNVVVDGGKRKMRLLSIEKSGGGNVGIDEMGELIEMAEGRWREVGSLLDKG